MQDAFRALSLDQRDEVADLLDHPGWKALLKLIDGIAADQERKVITMTVADGVDKVIQQKLKAEGSRSLAADVSRIPEYIRKINKKG